jgi:hypothetical protein
VAAGRFSSLAPVVGCRGYHWRMVDSALLEQVLRLDAESRRELIRAVEDSLDYDDVPPHVLAEIDRRLAEMGPDASSDAVPADEFLRGVRARRST